VALPPGLAQGSAGAPAAGIGSVARAARIGLPAGIALPAPIGPAPGIVAALGAPVGPCPPATGRIAMIVGPAAGFGPRGGAAGRATVGIVVDPRAEFGPG
jgi:hypothetical protein